MKILLCGHDMGLLVAQVFSAAQLAALKWRTIYRMKPLVAGVAGGYASQRALAVSASGGEEKEDEANWIVDSRIAGEWSGLCGAGCGAGRAGGESGDDNGEESIDALREKHGVGGRFHAGGEIWI